MVEEVETVLFLLVVWERVFTVTESVIASPILILVVEDGGADGGGEGVERGSIGGVGLDIVFDLLMFSLVGLWSEMWWNWDIRLPRLARRDLQTGWLREGLEVDRTWCL